MHHAVTKELVYACLVFEAIRDTYGSDVEWDGEEYVYTNQSNTALHLLKGYAEKYLHEDPDVLIETARKSISIRKGIHPAEVPHSDEMLLRLQLGSILDETLRIMYLTEGTA